MKKSLAIPGLVLCVMSLFIIRDIKNIRNVSENEVKPIPIDRYYLPPSVGNGAGNISFNLPLCGLGYKSFIFNVSNGEKLRNVHTFHKKTPEHLCRSTFRARNSLLLTTREGLNYKRCQKENSNPSEVFKKNYKYLKDIRLQFFNHLKDKKDSSVIEIGGYKGALTKSFLTEYRIQHYVVVEPVRENYENILKTLQMLNRSDVSVYQFGLGNGYSVMSVKDEGDATSLLSSKSTGNSDVKIVHAVDFFLLLGVACHDIDLLTINCEGCEFDLLEMLVSTNLIDRFVHIQFQPHCRREGIVPGDCACRYCRIQQLLARTHEIAYSFTQIWEAWRRKPN